MGVSRIESLCCKIRKVDPLKRALTGLECWITGLRREQTITRNEIKKIEIDSAHGNIVKLNPLADWTSDQIWKFIKDNEIPYNKLHDLGYPSIGCAPCTRAVKPGEDSRVAGGGGRIHLIRNVAYIGIP